MTKPSPPLLPGPQRTTVGRGDQRRTISPATPLPAASISSPLGDPRDGGGLIDQVVLGDGQDRHFRLLVRLFHRLEDSVGPWDCRGEFWQPEKSARRKRNRYIEK